MNFCDNVEDYDPNEGEELKSEGDTHNMAAIRLPLGHIDFVKKNPKLAQVVGSLVIARTEMQDRIKILDKILLDGEVFEGKLEDGTREELDAFLVALAEQSSSATLFKGLTQDQMTEVKTKLADSKLTGVISNINTGENEDIKL